MEKKRLISIIEYYLLFGPKRPEYIYNKLLEQNANVSKEELQECLDDGYYFEEFEDGTFGRNLNPDSYDVVWFDKGPYLKQVIKRLLGSQWKKYAKIDVRYSTLLGKTDPQYRNKKAEYYIHYGDKKVVVCFSLSSYTDALNYLEKHGFIVTQSTSYRTLARILNDKDDNDENVNDEDEEEYDEEEYDEEEYDEEEYDEEEYDEDDYDDTNKQNNINAEAVETSKASLIKDYLNKRIDIDTFLTLLRSLREESNQGNDNDDEYSIKKNSESSTKIASGKREHWFLSKFQNRDNADCFNINDFNRLADWSYGGSPSGISQKKYKTRSGNIIECDSKSELKLLEYLDCRSGLIAAIGGQALKISYSTHFRKNNNYSPDIVVLTTTGQIGIIEVKPTIAMSYHKNIEKYEALKEYCEENGFMYMMIDPDSDYMTFEDLKKMSVSQDIIGIFNHIEDYLEPELSGLYHFTKEDVDEWYREYRSDGENRRSFDLQVYSMIIWKGWFNTFDRGFNVYNRPVKLNYNHDVIDYI